MSDHVVRCPYCVQGDQPRPMLQKPDWFICEQGGHVVLPGDPDFKCACQRCLPIRGFTFADAQARIPSPESDHAVTLLQHGTLKVKLSLPRRPSVRAFALALRPFV